MIDNSLNRYLILCNTEIEKFYTIFCDNTTECSDQSVPPVSLVETNQNGGSFENVFFVLF